MYFSIMPSLLNSKLGILSQFVEANGHIKIEADDVNQRLILIAGGSRGFCSLEVSVKVTTSGVTIVDPNLLAKIARTYNGQIHIRLDYSGAKLMISPYPTFPKNSTVSIPTVNTSYSAQVPSFTIDKITRSARMNAASLNYALQSVRALKSDSSTGQQLVNAISIAYKQDSVEFAMSSSRGIVVSTVKAEVYLDPNGIAPKMNTLVPVEVLGKIPVTEDVNLVIEDYNTMVKIVGLTWFVLLPTVSTAFVSYDSILNTKPSAKLATATKDLLPILRRASLLIDSVSSASKSVVFDVGIDEMSVYLNSNKGEYSDHLICSQEGITAPIGFVIDDLISAITAVASDSSSMEWLGQAILVKADVGCKTAGIDDIVVKCLIKPVKVVNTPTQVVQKDDIIDIVVEDTEIDDITNIDSSIMDSEDREFDII